MQTWLSLLSTLLLVAGLTACGDDGSKQTFQTPEGDVEVISKDEGQVQTFTMKGPEGTASLTIGSQPQPADLGVPLYPGASAQEGTSWSMSGMNAGEEGSFASTMLVSKDSLDDVLGFYKKQLAERNPDIYEMSMPSGKMANIMVGDDETTATTILLTEDPAQGGTRIQITRTSK